jgi:glutaredoxin
MASYSTDVFNLSSGIIVFSKTVCPNCDKVKDFLTAISKDFVVIKCDDFLAADRDQFLRTMTELTGGVVPKVFPMVFVDRNYIGGYNETMKHFEDDDW